MYTPLSEAQPCVPKALEAIVNHALSYEPSQRYEDVETLANDVQAYMTGQTVSVYKETIVERAFRWCSRYRAIAGTIAAAALLLLIVSITSTLVIRSAHRAEREAKHEAKQAHHEALERLVESRDTADTWLVDLSGALQFHPSMNHLREELISQATGQYERLVSYPIRSLSNEAIGGVKESDWATLSLEWLERAKCHIRLGDLNRMTGNLNGSRKQYSAAERILEEIATTKHTVSKVSLTRSKDPNSVVANGLSHRGSLDELIEVEKINAVIGVALTDQQLPPMSKIVWARERFAEWLPWQPPKKSDAPPSNFVARVISAMVRLETVLGRISASKYSATHRAYSEDRINNAIEWAHWLSLNRGAPSDLQLYETVATDYAERISRLSKHRQAYELWDALVDELQRRINVHGERSDWIQSMAHARLRRAEATSAFTGCLSSITS